MKPKNPIEITRDTPEQMRRQSYRLGGRTDDRTMLAEIRRDYLAGAFRAVAFTYGERDAILYWVK